MRFRGVDVVCPACKGGLSETGAGLRCGACERTYPVLLGIPDLRVLPDPYIAMDKDRAKGASLAEATAGLPFDQALDRYYATTPEVPPVQARLFKRSVLSAQPRARERLSMWEPSAHGGALLEIGCGTGPLLLAARDRYDTVAGIDIAFRWLVAGQARLREAGASELPVLCACAEGLPFPDASFDRVAMDSSVECFQDQRMALREAFRVLRPGGRIFVTTPSRTSVGPDPHTGIPFGSLLPDRVTAAWVRRGGGIPPYRHLLSRRQLHDMLRDAGFEDVRIALPDIPRGQRDALGGFARVLVDAYHVAKRLPVARAVLLRIGPLLDATATRPARAA
jgi:SAM-dependent methyltransferase